jgi:hypothetical protein
MWSRLIVGGACLAVFGACQQAGDAANVVQNPAAPSVAEKPVAAPTAAPAASTAKPWRASFQFKATGIQWAGQPGVDKSDFGGRCSVPSDYIITAAFDGEATHAGHFTGSGSHCSQIAWTPNGPGGVTYSDGRGTLVSANGSQLHLRWGNGISGADPATGELWFKDQFTIVGGTGLFAGATGGGEEGGTLEDFPAVLAGAPVAMWMEGTITYGPGQGGR